jgi:predicted CXXCH cytochrome family protein
MVLIAIMLGTGCFSSPEQKYRVLSFFFDDVPPPGAATALRLPADPSALEPPTEDVEGPSLFWVTHEPYAQKKCLSCHESKFSPEKLQAELPELCWTCHEEADLPGKVMHGPVAGGFCLACHDPHRTRHPFMLLESRSNICVQCHDQHTFEIEQHREEKGGDCLRCHNPHASDREYLLRAGQDPDII